MPLTARIESLRKRHTEIEKQLNLEQNQDPHRTSSKSTS